MQAAAEGDVEYLEAAADREEGNVVLYRPARQLDFESVAGRGDLGGGRVRWLAKACGIHVTAPGQQHPVEPLQELGARGGAQLGRGRNRGPPPPLDRVEGRRAEVGAVRGFFRGGAR